MANYSSGGGLGSIPPVIKTILIINVIAFIAQNIIPGLTEWGALHYWTSTLFKPHQLVTMMFLHGSIGHIFFNMFALFIFGGILENFWGSKRFFNFYMVCGIIASIITLLSVPFSASQFVNNVNAAGDYSSVQVIEYYKQTYAALGASGAIMGVMAAFAYLFPNTEMYMMFIPIPIKAKYLVPGFIAIDLFGGLGYGMKGDNVAHWAHIGGALAGLIIVFIWNKTNHKNFY
jgi:membrane associated rhomboid family serine protease